MNKNSKQDAVSTSVKSGITFGSALAMVIRYVNWHSVGWANELGICYLLYS